VSTAQIKLADSNPKTAIAYTVGELMVAAAAREICDGELVFVGMRLPLIAFAVAKRTHAPHTIGLFENGVIRNTLAPELIYTMADPPNILGATQCLDMLSVMGLLQSGRVDLGFLGAAEVDRFGNLNSTQVRVAAGKGRDGRALRGQGFSPESDSDHTKNEDSALKGHGFSRELDSSHTRNQDSALKGHGFSRAERAAQRKGALAPEGAIIRLPGSGGACDIASLARRFVVLLEHSKRRLPEHVSYITSPGNGDGPGWRRRVGLPRGGPAAVITSKAVLRFGEDGEAFLASLHSGNTVEDVLEHTGWKLLVSETLSVTPEPSPEELAAIRDYDRRGFWTQ